MRLFVLLYFLCATLAMCDDSSSAERQRLFHSFDFSYTDVFSSCFSIKFSQTDTVFIRQHFASYFSDTPKSNTTYYAVLAKEDRIKLDSFIKATEFTNYDTLYYEDYVDGIDYQFYIENDSSERLVRVHTDSAPAQLNSLMNWIITTKEKLKICPLDSTIGFGSTKNFLPPRVPPPLTEFTEPKVE